MKQQGLKQEIQSHFQQRQRFDHFILGKRFKIKSHSWGMLHMSLPVSYTIAQGWKQFNKLNLQLLIKLYVNSEHTHTKNPSIACFLSGPALYSWVDSGDLRFIFETTEPKYAAPSRHCYGESYTSAVRRCKAKSWGSLCLKCWLSLLKKKSWTSMPESQKICNPWRNSHTFRSACALFMI